MQTLFWNKIPVIFDGLHYGPFFITNKKGENTMAKAKKKVVKKASKKKVIKKKLK